MTYSEPEEYSEPKYVQNLFRTCEAYSEPYQTSAMESFAKVGNDYNYTLFI